VHAPRRDRMSQGPFRQRALLLPSLALLAVLTSGGAAARPSAHAASCNTARVYYTPYPGGATGLTGIPWVRGTSGGLELVGLLWYWPTRWHAQGVRRALIYTGGETPDGHGPTMKILWAFLSAQAKRLDDGTALIVQGERLDGPGRSWQRFTPIGYEGQNGAPSYASIISLRTAGCWRLHLAAGRLRASVVFQAVKG
jgi:hypothetical protein